MLLITIIIKVKILISNFTYFVLPIKLIIKEINCFFLILNCLYLHNVPLKYKGIKNSCLYNLQSNFDLRLIFPEMENYFRF